MKDMSQEEIDAYMESIPEWKRGALVVAQTQEEEEKETRGMFGRAKDSLKERINETEAAKKFRESEEGKKL